MRLQRTLFVWKITMISLVMMLGGCGLPTALPAHDATNTPLLLAQSRWRAHHPARYRLVIQEDTSDRSCRQSVEVHDEQVQAVLEDHCGHASPWTISSLLDWIGYRARASAAYPAASIVSACQMFHSAHAVYDPRLGYPYTATYQRTLAPNWAYLRPLQQLFGARVAPDCTLPAGASSAITIRVVSLTALP